LANYALRLGRVNVIMGPGAWVTTGAFSVGAILVIALQVFGWHYGANMGFPLGEHKVRPTGGIYVARVGRDYWAKGFRYQALIWLSRVDRRTLEFSTRA
jgi:hypothetical protein